MSFEAIPYQLIAEQSAAGFWHLDEAGRTLYANPALLRLLEAESAAELDAEQARQLLRQAPAAGGSCQLTVSGRRGTRRRVAISTTVLADAQQCCLGTLAILVEVAPAEREQPDVGAPRPAADKPYLLVGQPDLKLGQQRLKKLLEHLPAFMWTVDRELRFTSAIGPGYLHVHVDPQEILGMRMQTFLQTEDEESEPLVAHRQALQGAPAHYEIGYGGFELEVYVEPLMGAGGEVLGALGVAIDITEQKQTRETLRLAYSRLEQLSEQVSRSRDLLRTLVDGLDDGILLLDQSRRVLTVNQAMTRIMGISLAEIAQQDWAALCDVQGLGFPGEAALQTLGDGRPRLRRESYSTPQKRYYILDVQTFPVLGCDQSVEQVIVHVADVTDRLQIEALARQHTRLDATGKLVATVAHELNSPLQAIQSCLDLAHEVDGAERDAFLAMAQEEIERIGAILRRLLDLHRPRGETLSAVDLNAIVERVLLLTSSTLQEHDIVVMCDLIPDLPRLWGRADQLTQVLLNLIFNAVDAMPSGGRLRIHSHVVQLELSAGAQGPVGIQLEVEDSGVGIAPELVDRVFDPFFTTKVDGSGLGLAISRQIVDHHGGTLRVRSKAGHGTCFTLCFTLKQEVAGPRATGAVEGLL